MDKVDTKVIYQQEGVCGIVPQSEGLSSNLLPGRLVVADSGLQFGVTIEWSLLDAKRDPPNSSVSQSECFDSNGWIIPDDEVDGMKCSPSPSTIQSLKKYEFSFNLKELRSFKYLNQNSRNNDQMLKFTCDDGTSHMFLKFCTGGVDSFLDVLTSRVILKRSAKEQDLIIVSDMKAEALQQSVSALFEDRAPDIISKFISNPLPTAMTGLGKVTSFVSDKIINVLLDIDQFDTDSQKRAAEKIQQQMRHEDYSRKLHMHRDDGGFELVVTGLDLPDRPCVQRDEPVSEEQWKEYKQADGSVINAEDLKTKIYRGGLDASLRPEVWRFLLGYYSWNSTTAQREALRKQKADAYYRMKLQWKTIDTDQEERFSQFRDRKQLIEKDVARTDRNNKLFEGENNGYINLLNDILMTYVMYNFDLGYVQGMSDLLSPILVVIPHEVDAFWTFVGFMDKTFRNFEMDQQHIKNQLMHLRDLLMYLSPSLLSYLESHDSDNMYFCFRWLLVLFKREFSFDDVMRLWEVLWTDKPCKNFHLLICLAIFEKQKDFIMENRFGLTEILKHINDLSMRIDLEETLSIAEGMYHQLASCQDRLPPHVCSILGFAYPEPLNTFARSGTSQAGSRSASPCGMNPSALPMNSPSTPSANKSLGSKYDNATANKVLVNAPPGPVYQRPSANGLHQHQTHGPGIATRTVVQSPRD